MALRVPARDVSPGRLRVRGQDELRTDRGGRHRLAEGLANSVVQDGPAVVGDLVMILDECEQASEVVLALGELPSFGRPAPPPAPPHPPPPAPRPGPSHPP